MKTEGVVLPQATWEDIVFEKRNKEYGAFLNRKNYSKHVYIALAITFLALTMVFAAPYIAELLKSNEVENNDNLRDMTVNLDQPPPITPNQPPPPDVRIPPPVKTIIKFLPPKVTEKEVVEEEEMPTIEEIKENETGAVAQEGTGEVVFDEPVVEAPAGNDDDKIFYAVEQSAEFPGGLQAMMKFLQKNIKYPASAKRMGIEGRVFVKFIVDKEGGISNMEIVKGINADLDKEAMRVIKLMPPWKPGKQNGRAVKSQFVLPVYFKLDS
jgi:periplasmic protein TonB